MCRALTVSFVLWIGACGASEDHRAEARTNEAQRTEDSVEAPREEPTSPEPGGEALDARRDAVRTAEAFVRAQGYADTPATVSGDEVVHEGIEGTLEMRRNMLDPSAVSASGEGDTWSVAFRYVEPEYAGRGRMLMLRPGQAPSFVHQDLVLSP